MDADDASAPRSATSPIVGCYGGWSQPRVEACGAEACRSSDDADHPARFRGIPARWPLALFVTTDIVPPYRNGVDHDHPPPRPRPRARQPRLARQLAQLLLRQ